MNRSTKRKQSMKPLEGWILFHSDNYVSSIIEFDEAMVIKNIRCAKACKEPVPRYVKVRLTEIE